MAGPDDIGDRRDLGDVPSHRLFLNRLAERAPFEFVSHEQQGGAGSSAPLAGHPADRPDLHPDPDDLVVAVGHGLRILHDLETGPLLEPGGEATGPAFGWEAVKARCVAAVGGSSVDPDRLPEPYNRYSADQLLSMFVEGKPEKADDSSDLVVCHGRPTMDRFYVDGGQFQGFTAVDDALVADRHLDLAVIHQSVQVVLGREAVFRFYESYGQDPNLARLEHYVLASHLLGTAPLSTNTPSAGQ